MGKIFQLLAVVFAGIAAFLWWRGSADGLFICTVFGAVCFFLGIRFEVGARVKQRRAETEANAAEDFLLADTAEDFNQINDEDRKIYDERKTNL